jgi:hypothetical protein
MEQVYYNYKMVKNIKANGKIIKKMAMDNIYGQQVVVI